MRGLTLRRFWQPTIFLCICVSAAATQSEGLPAEWAIRADLDALTRQIGSLKSALEEVKLDQWSEKTSIEAYRTQWKSVIDELGFVVRAASELSRDPERLTAALETYLRMQSVDEMTGSLNEGVRRYQDAGLADRIRSEQSGAAAAREKLRQYILQLAAVQESQFKVMSEEAQRCRAALSRQPAPAKGSPSKKTEPK